MAIVVNNLKVYMCFMAERLACVTPLRHYIVLTRSMIQETLAKCFRIVELRESCPC